MITLLTPTLPERADLFAELAQTVAAQTELPDRWLVEWDHERRGPIEVVNRLASQVETEWLFRIDDDDLLEPNHFETLAPHLTKDADVVYSWCRVEGGGTEHPPEQFQVSWQNIVGWEGLRTANWIPSAACVRTSMWKHLGGYGRCEWTNHEDWEFWVRALDAGANFVCVPQVTWTYRLNTEWAHKSAA